ncbi:MAG: cytochrome c [Gammaproteobacteria bacterium]|nr:cytochrome c [Gammaproteobacteria bacterium]
MNYTALKSILTGALILISTCNPAYAEGDPEEGKVKFLMCAGCHAIPGYSNVFPRFQVPKLGGQHAEFIINSLKSYAKGERQHVSMTGTALSLTEQDMQNIAEYLASLKFAVNIDKDEAFGNPVAGKKKAKNCASCHGKKGKSASPGFPNLIGQYETYLIHALQQYRSGNRTNPMMTGMAAALSDEDIEDIAAYYASQKKGLSTPR